MRITDDIIHCAIYVGFADKNGDKIVGTAFWISVPMEDMGKNHLVIVTAKHIIEAIPAKSTIRLRMNPHNGEAQWIPTERSNWSICTENDVAIYVWRKEHDGSLDDYHFYSIDKTAHANKDRIKKDLIGIGDEVITVGLFSRHSGRRRNHPIVRTGNIAALPEDKVETRLYGNIEAYLIELRSTSGLSGSPVFVHMPTGSSLRPIKTDSAPSGSSLERLSFSLSDTALLFGVMHGHFDIDTDKADYAIKEEEIERLNTGIGVVVPN